MRCCREQRFGLQRRNWFHLQPCRPRASPRHATQCVKPAVISSRCAQSRCRDSSRVSRLTASAKSNLDVPATTSVEGRTLTVHYLRRQQDVQVSHQHRESARALIPCLMYIFVCVNNISSSNNGRVLPPCVQQDWRLHIWGEVQRPTTETTRLNHDR